MPNTVFKECLAAIYEAEQLGEYLFEWMLPKAANPDQRRTLMAMLQLEAEAKAMIRPYMVRFDISCGPNEDAYQQMRQISEGASPEAWKENFQMIGNSARQTYLPLYEQLATLVDPDEAPDVVKMAEFMGAHERAIITSMDRIVADEPDHLDPILKLLHFPINP